MMMMMESNKCRQTLSSPLNNVGHNVCVVALLLVGCALINASPAGRPTSAALPLPTSAPDVQSSTTSTTSASATTVASKNSIINDNYFEFSSDDDASSTRNADATIDDDDAANNANYDDPAPMPSPCQLDCFATFAFSSKIDCFGDAKCDECWLQCAHKQQQQPPLRPLRVVAMVKQEFLVQTRIAWPQLPTLDECYVTWEVASGGLIGHMVADAGAAELSLWPDTKYRVVVVCKDRSTGMLIRSPTLLINTMQAMSMKPDPPTFEEIQELARKAMPSTSSTSFNLENRILKGSERNTKAPRAPPKESILVYSPDIDNAPHIRPAIETWDIDTLTNFFECTFVILLVILTVMLIDCICFGVFRKALSPRSKLPSEAVPSDSRRPHNLTIAPTIAASKTTSSPSLALPHFVKYATENAATTTSTTHNR